MITEARGPKPSVQGSPSSGPLSSSVDQRVPSAGPVAVSGSPLDHFTTGAVIPLEVDDLPESFSSTPSHHQEGFTGMYWDLDR